MEELAAVVCGFSYVMLKGKQVPDAPTAFGKFYGLLARRRTALAGGNFMP